MANLKIATISNTKGGSRIICSDMVLLTNSNIAYFSGYGPSQEVRAFAQHLQKGESRLEIIDQEDGGEIFCRYSMTSAFKIRFTTLAQGYAGISVLPDSEDVIISDTEDESRKIFYSLLSLKYFAHQDWYPALFKSLKKLETVVGNKTGFFNNINIENSVRMGLADGSFVFPESTESLVLEVLEDEKKDAA